MIICLLPAKFGMTLGLFAFRSLSLRESVGNAPALSYKGFVVPNLTAKVFSAVKYCCAVREVVMPDASIVMANKKRLIKQAGCFTDRVFFIGQN